MLSQVLATYFRTYVMHFFQTRMAKHEIVDSVVLDDVDDPAPEDEDISLKVTWQKGQG